MVVRRTVHALRQRPHDERRALAGGIALAVVGVLLVGWIAFSIRHVTFGSSAPAQSNAASTTATTQSQTQASSTGGIQIEYIGATSSGQ